MKLLRKYVKFEWNSDCQQSFKILKEKLFTMPVLMLLVEEGHYVVFSDASNQGLSCVLIENRRLMAYASRQLRPHE